MPASPNDSLIRRMHAYTDLYDEQKNTFLVQYPVWLVIGLGLAGVIVFMLTGFLGYRDPLEGDFTSKVFHEPWALYLWFCALIITLQCSILRHPRLRRYLVMTLTVTLFCIVFVGIIYYYNQQLIPALQDLLEKLFQIQLPEIGKSKWTYAIINFGVIAVFWFATIRRWIRRASGKPLHASEDIGLGDEDDSRQEYPDMRQLVSGDLISGAVLVLALSLIFRMEVVNFFSDLIQSNVHVNTCAVSWPFGACAAGGSGIANPPTLSFIDLIQALIYLPLGLLILALAAVINGLGKEVDADSAVSIGQRVVEELINTIKAALNRRGGIAFNLSLALRSVAWPILIFIGVLSVAAASRAIQMYLHLLSDKNTCSTVVKCGGQQTFDFVKAALASHQEYASAALALLLGVVAVLSIVFSVALLLFRWRVAENSLRFLGLVGFTVLLTFWIFSLALSGFNGLFSLTNLSNRVPFPQPGPTTIISAASLLIFGAYLMVQRVRGGSSAKQPASVAAPTEPPQQRQQQ